MELGVLQLVRHLTAVLRSDLSEEILARGIEDLKMLRCRYRFSARRFSHYPRKIYQVLDMAKVALLKNKERGLALVKLAAHATA